MVQIDPGLEITDEEFFRQEAIVVRLLLGLSGLSQDRLAELSGVGQNSISLYQRGKLVPSPETLDLLADKAGWPLPAVEQMATTAIRIREHPRAFASLQLASPAVEVGRKVAVLVDAVLTLAAGARVVHSRRHRLIQQCHRGGHAAPRRRLGVERLGSPSTSHRFARGRELRRQDLGHHRPDLIPGRSGPRSGRPGPRSE